MLVKLDKPKILTDAISLISELVTEVRIKLNKDGLSITAIDPANVALISFKIPCSQFSAFEANDEVLGISLDSLKSVLRRASAGSSIILQSQEDSLKIEIHDKIKRVFNLALINIDAEEKEMPMLDFSSKIEMPSIDFSQAIEDCGVVGDSCTFNLEEDKFIIEAKGLHSTKSEFSGDEIKIIPGKGKSKYSLEYLKKFAKACKMTDNVKINFSNDYPLKLEFPSDSFYIAFVLAPRVETE
ncbi:MAG: proliferating cell nuclear antigen (pcna) [Nanoarchaeota archaeon]|nr:proliferating cell nuclear antigen (pcna) [Nanoarchaeota archaeon]